MVNDIKVTDKGIFIPRELFKELLDVYSKVEQILATLETLADKETLEAIKKGKEEIAKGNYVECKIENLEETLK